MEAGDRIRTGSLSTARLVFFEGSTTDLMASTEVAVTQVSARREGSGKIIEQKGKLLRVLKKQPDGSWKVARVIAHNDP